MSDKDITEDFEEVLDDEQRQEAADNEINEEENAAEAELSVEDQLREDLAKEKDKFLRLFAEFENFKKRTSKERMEMFKTAGQEIMVSMLPVLDDFDRALKELAKSEDKEMFKGVELIRVKFRETLKSKGLEEVEANQGDTFDAEVHDAITQIPAPDKKLKGKLIDVVEKGYKLGERIIRHPKVVVGN
ncbi:nucleotide exchange factor GrpE [Euzebyella marina]|uniref:Protein GrpE n=1 Tax=Euzebyella marina TaxID=1761453 RepID=A0A3G2L965_9FLAO|nr:nucleotide exchange factor GrpE [Euzebyella marina]AYN68784.1 nucleotide exchange factor GrpE [Euzebyella marina]MAU72129.1 nucleotide exchange factor GrpE [Pseudozobellia sp.]MBG48685.1 nucleotide exchange factor GrpE [Pseudozobellia sp.]|tara:strand:- start:282447 stop:283010 length:564 start_codon:yes stop_codon:yes gene_type:complete